jgi:hypothetical protein
VSDFLDQARYTSAAVAGIAIAGFILGFEELVEDSVSESK